MEFLVDVSILEVENGTFPEYVCEEDMAGKDPRLDEFMPLLKALREQQERETWFQWIKKDKMHVMTTIAVAIAILTLLVAYFAWWQPQSKQAELQQLQSTVSESIEQKLKALHFDQLGADVSEMKGQMVEISRYVQLLTEKEMRNDASLSQREFQGHISSLPATLAAARVSRTVVSPHIVEAIGKKLARVDKSQLEYWQAASQFISYCSGPQSGSLFEGEVNCLNAIRSGNNWDEVPTPSGKMSIPGFAPDAGRPWMSHVQLSKCVLYLDDDGGFDQTSVGRFFLDVRKHHPNLILLSLVLNDVKIVYSGGKMLPVSEIQYSNCVFDFRMPTSVPPKRGQALSDGLLTADLKVGTVEVPVGM
jgi:hypothetical protein